MGHSIIIYQPSKSVRKYYRENVKGNEGASDLIVQRKLSRNIALAIKVHVKKDKSIYLYGNLHIHTKGNKITDIVNHKERNDWFYLDRKKKKKLNIELGLDIAMNQWREEGNLSYIDEYSKGLMERMNKKILKIK